MNLKFYLLVIFALFALLIGIFVYKGLVSPTIKIDGHTFSLILAKDEKDKQIGLSKYSKIDQDKGMLFIFDKADFYPFWMKDMKFPIDIIFINGNKIVTIYAEVPTSNGNLILYTPTEPADRVLEVKAQTSTKYNFKVGDSVEYKNIR